MEIHEIKLIMITEYKKQFIKLVDKFNLGELDLKGLTYNINLLNHRYNYIRVDVKNFGCLSNDILFLEYGKNIRMYKPDWFVNNLGIGYQLECCNGGLDFIFKCLNQGNLKIFIRGIDFRDIDNVRVPIYVNFTNLIINDKPILNQNNCIWHDKPYIFEKIVEDQQHISISLKFKTLFDYFPSLNIKISDDICEDEIIPFCIKIIKYINMIIPLLNEKSFK